MINNGICMTIQSRTTSKSILKINLAWGIDDLTKNNVLTPSHQEHKEIRLKTSFGFLCAFVSWCEKRFFSGL